MHGTSRPSNPITYEIENEGELLRNATAGDRGALDALFAKNHSTLFHTALQVLGNPDDAEDALQDGMLAAYRNLERFQGRSQFSTWLTRIVINAALMRRRSQRAHPALALDAEAGEGATTFADWFADDGPSPEDLCAGNEISAHLQRNLDELSPLLRDAFELRELDGLSTDEAARTLGVSRNTLKARLWRARRQLAAGLRAIRGRREQGPEASSVPARGLASAAEATG